LAADWTPHTSYTVIQPWPLNENFDNETKTSFY